MSWLLTAYDSIPQEKRAAFLNSLDPSALSSLSFSQEKKDYEAACKRYKIVQEIESHFKGVTIPKSSTSVVDKIKKAYNFFYHGPQTDGFYFNSIGEILRHRPKDFRIIFYYRTDPSCIGVNVLNSETYRTVRDVLCTTYGVTMEPVGPSRHDNYMFEVAIGNQVYFNVSIGPHGAFLGKDWCTYGERKLFDKPFHT